MNFKTVYKLISFKLILFFTLTLDLLLFYYIYMSVFNAVYWKTF